LTAKFSREDLLRKVKPTSFSDYRVFFYALFRILKAANPSYDYEAFAGTLGFKNEEQLKSVMFDGNNLSKAQAGEIALMLPLSDIEKSYFQKLVEYTQANGSGNASKLLLDLMKIKARVGRESLSPEKANYFSRWFIPVIGEMAMLDGFVSDPTWIGETLVPAIAPENVAEALELLQQIGILSFDGKSQRYSRTGADLSTADEVGGSQVARFHREMIDLGRNSLESVPPSEREISSVTLSVSERLIQKIKTLIHEFEQEVLAEEAGESCKDQMYQLNVQFFPVTKKTGKKKE
jgi:uncharacterized protein (TIGR02147 family)